MKKNKTQRREHRLGKRKAQQIWRARQMNTNRNNLLKGDLFQTMIRPLHENESGIEVIGVDGETGYCFDSTKTAEQIQRVSQLDCHLYWNKPIKNLNQLTISAIPTQSHGSHQRDSMEFESILMNHRQVLVSQESKDDHFLEEHALIRTVEQIQREHKSRIITVPLMNYILDDRRRRAQNRGWMADRPPIAVLYLHDNAIVRMEFYRGHDNLTQILDLRDINNQGTQMNPFMDKDPYRYVPMQFVQNSLFGIIKANLFETQQIDQELEGLLYTATDRHLNALHEAYYSDFCKIHLDSQSGNAAA